MNNIILITLQCGAFVLIPLCTFGIGFYLIDRFVGFENKFSFVLNAFLVGITFFMGSFTGMMIDSRIGPSMILKIIKTSGLIGLAVFVAVLIFIPIYRVMIQMFK